MGADEQSLPAAGWFDDPDGRSGVKRYWDGRQWTDRYDESGSGPSRINEIDRKFNSLYTIAKVFHVLGWVTLILGSLFVIVAAIAAGSADDSVSTVFGETQRTEPGANAAVILIGGGIGVAIYTLFFFAAAAFTRLMLRVEDNTHRSAVAIEKLQTVGGGHQGGGASA